MAALASMPVLTASQPMSRDHGLDLRGDDVVGHDVDAGDADGVLGRHRGDGRGAVDAVGGKCLQIGLDAGAAARIGARNCQGGTHTSRIRVS